MRLGLADHVGWAIAVTATAGHQVVDRRRIAKHVEARAGEALGARAAAVLRGPREQLGPPWAKDHRMALAATVVGG